MNKLQILNSVLIPRVYLLAASALSSVLLLHQGRLCKRSIFHVQINALSAMSLCCHQKPSP